MSQHERSWLRYLEAYELGTEGLTQAQIAILMGCQVRTVQRRLERYRSQGDAGLVHRGRGRPSNRRLGEDLVRQALSLLTERYDDFGPTFAAEKLAECHGLPISRERLRQLMIEHGLWRPKARKIKHRQWRERRACVGELVQVDASLHDWFEGRGPQVVLISLSDDATSRVCRRFYDTDSTATNLRHLQDYLRRHGRPKALYGDKASHFVTTRPATVEEQLEGEKPQTQLGRALRELDIDWITAHSPQAKGRVERSFNTAQDRLVKELRLANISDLQTANDFLEEYDARVTNQRFAVSPACDLDAHRAVAGYDLAAILSVQKQRTLTRDYCLQFGHQRYQIPRGAAAAGMVGSKVTVEQRLDGSRQFRWRDQYLPCVPVPRPAGAAAMPPAVGLRPSSGAIARPTAVTPKPDHPWRRNLQGAFRSQRP